LLYPPTPAADKAGWARLNKLGPYYAPHKATCGVGMNAQNPVELPNYPYPIFMAYASQPADLVHAVTKSMIADYAAYKDGAPGAAGLELARQNLTWVLPYHDGAVRAFKEAGVWKAEHEAHQQKALARQATLAKAWDAYLKTNPPEAADAMRKGWMAARAAALSKAGFDTIFE
jgi:hypothetical protein